MLADGIHTWPQAAAIIGVAFAIVAFMIAVVWIVVLSGDKD